MKVVLVKPGEPGVITEIKSDLISMQEIVGGLIQAIYPFEDEVAIVCNDEGKINGLPLNRFLFDKESTPYDIIAGDFFVCGLTEDSFGSLSDELAEKYKKKFENLIGVFV